MQWKRAFWSTKWRRRLRLRSNDIAKVKGLIETSIADTTQGREAFEKKLDGILESYNVVHNKLDKDVIIKKVWERQISRFTDLMEQFINKYQQHYGCEELSIFEQKVENYSRGERAHTFLSLGITVLKMYNEILPLNPKPEKYRQYNGYSLDFNQVLIKSIETIDSRQIDDEVRRIQYMMIDEFQDFSELFYRLILSILSRNQNVRLFCVGDTWQAINRFMGSDTRYFESFGELFPDSKHVEITTNYRSAPQIISITNSFMVNNYFTGSPAKPYKDSAGSEIKLICITDLWIESRAENSSGEEYMADLAFRSVICENAINDYGLVRYIKACIQIIKDNRKASTLILHRKNTAFGRYSLEYLQTRIRKYAVQRLSYSKEEVENIGVQTMHRAKGLESDVVIILEANQNVIPLVHPDTELFEIFGETPEVTLMDEMRLFYVALTRAKRKIYILYESEKMSDFVQALNIQN